MSLDARALGLSDETCRSLLVFFWSKGLMIPPAYLCDAGIEVYEVTLQAGQVLMAGGTWIHCGLNLTPYSVGAAINFEDERGMMTNPAVLQTHVEWLVTHHPDTVAGAAHVAEWESKVLDPRWNGILSEPHLWSHALNPTLHHYACQRLQEQYFDLYRHLSQRKHLTSAYLRDEEYRYVASALSLLSASSRLAF